MAFRKNAIACALYAKHAIPSEISCLSHENLSIFTYTSSVYLRCSSVRLFIYDITHLSLRSANCRIIIKVTDSMTSKIVFSRALARMSFQSSPVVFDKVKLALEQLLK